MPKAPADNSTSVFCKALLIVTISGVFVMLSFNVFTMKTMPVRSYPPPTARRSNSFNRKDSGTKFWRSAQRFVSMSTNLIGGTRLGNKLFQFAAMLHVARLTNRSVIMPSFYPGGWLDQWFDINIRRYGSIQNMSQEICPCTVLSETLVGAYETSWSSLPRKTELNNVTTLLINGFFQSWKYASLVEQELRQTLGWKPHILIAIKNYFEQIRPPGWTNRFLRVGVHVRLGDFLHSGFQRAGFTVAGVSYYREAAAYFTKNASTNVQFIVATNEPAWVKKNLPIEVFGANKSSINVSLSIGHDPGFDMALLSSCDALIISTGSYGWWAAWLANKTTIYFQNYPKRHSHLARVFKREDYYLPYWKPIDSEIWRTA